MISLDAKGGFTYGARSPLDYLLAPGTLTYRGTFVFADGLIKAEWKKEGNPLAIFDEQRMEIEVIAITSNQLELRFQPGHPSEVFRRER